MKIKKLFIPPVLILLSILIITLLFFILPEFNFIPFPYNLGGIFISLTGFFIMLKTKKLFSNYQTTLSIDKPAFLITEGIFSKTRNPMYSGMFLLLLGAAVCFKNIFSIFTPFIYISLIWILHVYTEEKLLYDVFGDEYLEYKNKVRRWFLF